MALYNTYKICIIGDSNVGKSQYVRKLTNELHTHEQFTLNNNTRNKLQQLQIDINSNDFRAKLGLHTANVYTPTIGVEAHPVIFNTNIGTIKVYFYEIGGTYRGTNVQDYYKEAHGVIVLSTPSTTHNKQRWLNEINICAPNARKFDCHNINNKVVIAGTDIDPMKFILRKITNNNSLVIFSN